MHNMPELVRQSVGFVPDQGNNHAVEIEEEHEKVKAEFDKRFLSRVSICVIVCAFNLTFLWTLSLRKISVASRRCWLSKIFFPLNASSGRFSTRASQ